MVITDSFHSDIEGKNYKFGTPNKLNKTSKPLILFYFVQDYKRTWDEENPLNYDDPQLKNDAIVTKIESEGDVLNISLFDYESLDETELRFEVGKETSISKVVDENDHTKEYKFIPTKIVVADSLEKGSKVYDELMETVWTNYYIKNSKEGEKIPKVAENVENLAAEGHSHNKSSYKKCAECSDSVFELEEEICFECSSFGAEYEKTDDERILGIHNGNGNKVGTVSIEDVSDNKDKVFISIDGYNEEDEHGWHPMIWDGVIPESPFNAETFNAYSQESRIQNLIDKLYDDREIALNKLLKINNPSLQNLISKNALLRDRVGDMTLAEWSQVQNQLKYTPSGRIRTFGAETFGVDVIHRKDGIEVGDNSIANEYQCGECDSVYDNSSDATICCKCSSCDEPIHEGYCIKNAETFEDCEVCYATVDKGTLNDVQAGRICNECHKLNQYDAETFEANAKTGNKVYIITRRCEDYSAYRELDVAGFGSLTEARKKFNILFKEAKKQDYANYTIADAKYYMSWGEFWGIMSFNDGEMIYELREVIVGDKGDFYFDAEGEINE